MAFPVINFKSRIKKVPLPMDHTNSHNENEHVISIASTSNVFSSHEGLPSGLDDPPSSRASVYQPSLLSSRSNSRSSLVRRGSSRGRQRSPLNSFLWISVELVLTITQIIAAIVVLCLSKNEKPTAPLKAWIVGYASGCVAILPLLYWRFIHRNPGTENASLLQQDTSRGSSNGENRLTSDLDSRGTQNNGLPNPRLKVAMEYFKMALDCFFAVWFVVGNVWIFGGHSSSTEAPNVYRLCIVFLAFSCIGYAMPFILCTTICCCLPCIVSVLGYREDFTTNRGATQDSINLLPTYKFKVKRNKNGNNKENGLGAGEGGIVGIGTDKERVVSADDAVCCICLAKYMNNDELRELPCTHFFHKECVDKWLKINASCPLCKAEVGEAILSSMIQTTASLRNATAS